MVAYVYWSKEFKVWEVWFTSLRIPSQYFPYKKEAVAYAKSQTENVEVGTRG